MIVVPIGPIGLDFAKSMRDPVSGNRRQWFTYHLLDTAEASNGSLGGVTGGRLEWHSTAAVKSGGKITAVSRSRDDIDWLNSRVKIVMHIENVGAYPLGVFIPSAPVEKWDDMNLSLEVELLDKCSLLDNDYITNTHSLPEGTNVTGEVRRLIESTGEKAGSITDSEETLTKHMIWESGTSKLQVANDLLESAFYQSLFVDGDGDFKVSKNRQPHKRPVVHEFLDDAKSIYVPTFSYERDVYSIPNKVILIAQGDGDEEAMRAVATNEHPNSPYSRQRRGRWIVDVLKGVSATSQEALDERAQARLANLTSPTGILNITHAPLPWLGINEAVRFKRTEADIDIRAVIVSTAIELKAETLQQTQLQEVADL